MKIGCIFNGKIKNCKSVVADLQHHFQPLPIAVFVSEYPGHLASLCHRAIDENCDHLIFVGGDGSVNEGINGLCDHFQTHPDRNPGDFDWGAIGQIKLGIYPAGTGNDFVKTIYGSITLAQLAEKIKKGKLISYDLGWTRYQDFSGRPTVRFFTNIADIGMGTEVVRKTAALPLWWPSKLRYLWSITTTLMTYRHQKVRITLPEQNWQNQIINLVVANGKYFGNGLGIAPEASPTNSVFSLVEIGEISMLTYLKKIGQVKKCLPINHEKIRYKTSPTISIAPAGDAAVFLEIDGEFVGKTPVEMRCLEKKLTWLA